MRSTIRLDIDITHEASLPTDAQGIADQVGRDLTRYLSGDPTLLATAQVRRAKVEGLRALTVEAIA